MLLLCIMALVLTFARGNEKETKTRFSSVWTLSHCSLQLVWLFATTPSETRHCSQPVQRGDLYQVESHGGGGEREMFWSSCLPQPPSHGQPLRVWRLSRAMRGWRGTAGAWAQGAHCSTAGPHQLRPAGTTLKDTQNWGKELPGIPLVGAGWEREREKKGKVCEHVLLGEIVLISKMI